MTLRVQSSGDMDYHLKRFVDSFDVNDEYGSPFDRDRPASGVKRANLRDLPGGTLLYVEGSILLHIILSGLMMLIIGRLLIYGETGMQMA